MTAELSVAHADKQTVVPENFGDRAPSDKKERQKMQLSFALNVSYLNLPARRQKLLDGIELLDAIQRILDSIAANPELTRLTIKSSVLRQARLFHQRHAGNMRRKYDQDKKQSQHDEAMTEGSIRTWQEIFKKNPPINIVVEWLFHDSIEDYGVLFTDIQNFSGAAVAQGVQDVTTPSKRELRKLYPNLADRSKMFLKHEFRKNAVRDYKISSVILKLFHDNNAALESYIEDMKADYVQITTDPSKVTEKGVSPAVILESRMLDNLHYRRQYNKLLEQRARQLAQMPEMEPYRATLETKVSESVLDFASLSARYTGAVWAARDRYRIEHEQRPSSDAALEPAVGAMIGASPIEQQSAARPEDAKRDILCSATP